MNNNLTFGIIYYLFFSFNCSLSAQSENDNREIYSNEIIRLYNEATQAHRMGRSELSYNKLDSIISLSIENEDEHTRVAIGLAYKAKYANQNYHLHTFYDAIKKTEDYFNQYGNTLGIDGAITQVNNTMSLGVYYIRRGSLNRAQNIFDNLIIKLKSDTLNWNYQTTTSLLNLGGTHQKKGNYQLSLSYILEARDSFNIGKKEQFSEGYEQLIEKHLADTYALLGQNDSAKYYYEKAITGLKRVQITSRSIRNRIITSHLGY